MLWNYSVSGHDPNYRKDWRMHLRSRMTAAAAAVTIAGGLTFVGMTAALASPSGGGNPQPTCTPVPIGVSGSGHDVCPTPSYKPTPTVTPTTQGAPVPCIRPGYPRGCFTPTPRPTPTVTVPVGQSQGLPGQEDFDLTILNNATTVTATGPVVFNTGTDTTLSDILDRFAQGGNSVRVHHFALSGLAIDRLTCTITIDQDNLPWSFSNGTGAYAGVRGAGFYTLRGIVSFPTRDFRCTIPAGLSVGQATDDLNGNGGGLPQPSLVDIAVQGTGWASLPTLTRVVTVPPPCKPIPWVQVADYLR